MTHVPFKGTSESVPALLGGHVEMAFAAYPNLSGAIPTGNVTVIATNSLKRAAVAPDVPPVADFIPGYVFAPTVGLYARTGTPQAVLDKIAAEVTAIAKEPEFGKLLAAAGIEAEGARHRGLPGDAEARERERRKDREGRRHEAGVGGSSWRALARRATRRPQASGCRGSRAASRPHTPCETARGAAIRAPRRSRNPRRRRARASPGSRSRRRPSP